MDNQKKVKVTNKQRGTVGYIIPDMNNLTRLFQPGETKVLTEEEIFKLSQIPGGEYILNNSLIIEDADVVEEIIGEVEPEYYYNEEDIKRIMMTGTIDEFDDMLTFSPEGNLEVVKRLAVDLPLNDIAKRDLILKKTGFSVTNAITIAEEDKESTEEKPKRKAVIPAANKPARKAVAPGSK